MRPRALVPLLAATALAATARADERAGTLAEPIEIDAFPYAHAGDTTGRESAIDAYSCAASTEEAGPEVIYHAVLPARGRVSAALDGDVPGGVDVDVQILDDVAVANGQASCLARGNRWAEADAPAGDVWIAVDTYGSPAGAHPGGYTLRVDFTAFDRVRERPVARGVTWQQGLFTSLYGGDQTVNQLIVDPSVAGVALRPVLAAGCERVSSMGARTGAVAGVNAGFFDPANRCAPVSLVRIDDQTLAFNRNDRPPRAALGLGDAGPVVSRIAGDDPWAGVHEAIGGTPTLLRDGAPMVLWSEESSGQDFASYRHPRTGSCILPGGKLLFVTFDGRSEVGTGLSLFDLADYLVAQGCIDGLNFDGGGSTTFWVAGQYANGVMNYPSDGGMANHQGERSVSNGWFVYAPPYDSPPRFTTEPVLTARDGVGYLYDADALDLELSPIAFSLVEGPAGMTVNAMDGHVLWSPSYRDGGDHAVTLRASDGAGQTDQNYVIRVMVRDDDGDGLPDAWETQYSTDATRDDAHEDPDGDGADNLAEYYAGTDPHDAASTPRGIDAGHDGGADVVADAGPAADVRAGADAGEAAERTGCACAAGGMRSRGETRGLLAALIVALIAVTERRRARY